MISRQLFQGQRVRFTALDPDSDADVLARWSHDPDYLRRINDELRPITPAMARKRIDDWVADMNKQAAVHFGVRLHGEARLIGTVAIDNIVWPHTAAGLKIGIGNPADRMQGLGSDAMRLLLAYAFNELNLHRVHATLGAHNVEAVRFLKRFGFIEEARLRSAVLWNNARWPQLELGLLRPEWRP
jgi:RimJ/RimL family protein N-acetyltransferase